MSSQLSPNYSSPTDDSNGPILIAIVLVVMLRLVTLGCPPFLDRTDSRAALISRILTETHNPFNLQLPIEGVLRPYWAKPPLHYWLGAVSQNIFGANEIGARLPSFAAYLLTLAATFLFGRRLTGGTNALRAALILSSTPLFFIVSGLALPDNSLLCFIVAAIYFAHSAITTSANGSGLIPAAFSGAALALGVLVKGPIAIVLVWGAVFAWLVWERACLRELIPEFLVHCFTAGMILVPLFVKLEFINPGYLKYMLVTENFRRFIDSAAAVNFGSVHQSYYGLGIAYGILGFLPWAISILRISWLRGLIRDGDSATKLLICCSVWPLVFFSLTKSTLGTYVLPSLPFLSLLCAKAISVQAYKDAFIRAVLFAMSVAGLVFGMTADIDHEHVIYVLLLTGALAIGGAFGGRQQRYVRLAIGSAIVIATTTFSLNAYLSDRYSTKHILTTLKAAGSGGPSRFVWETPYSAFMYDDALLHRLIAKGNINFCAGTVVSRKKDLHLLARSPEGHVTHQHGKWIWIEDGCDLIVD